jgi:hypothetical protein
MKSIGASPIQDTGKLLHTSPEVHHPFFWPNPYKPTRSIEESKRRRYFIPSIAKEKKKQGIARQECYTLQAR